MGRVWLLDRDVLGIPGGWFSVLHEGLGVGYRWYRRHWDTVGHVWWKWHRWWWRIRKAIRYRRVKRLWGYRSTIRRRLG